MQLHSAFIDLSNRSPDSQNQRINRNSPSEMAGKKSGDAPQTSCCDKCNTRFGFITRKVWCLNLATLWQLQYLGDIIFLLMSVCVHYCSLFYSSRKHVQNVGCIFVPTVSPYYPLIPSYHQQKPPAGILPWSEFVLGM